MRLPPFRLERFFATREFAAPWNLCASDCEPLTVADLLALDGVGPDALARHRLGYTETAGDPELRREIAALYDAIDPGGVLVHAGGQEAIFTFMNATLRAGDHVVVHHPCYQSLREIPSGIGCEVTLWRARPEDAWALDLDALRGALRSDTRAVVVNLPHSPTGFLMTRAAWDELIAIVGERGVALFSDEAYRGLEYREADQLPAACDLYENAVSLGVLSKGYGLAGLRIGWLATRNAGLLQAITELKDYTPICASAPSELLARIAVRHSEMLLGRGRSIVVRNLEQLAAFFGRQRERFDWTPPRAGPVTYPTLRGGEDVEAFCSRALDEAGILLLPGTVFERPSRQIRFGFGRENLPEALARFEEWLGA